MKWLEDEEVEAKRDLLPDELGKGKFRSLHDLVKEAVKTKPSYPNLVDEYEPTDSNLWDLMLEVASGERLKYQRGDREVNSPNGARGYRNMPHNPKGIAWAIKQYKGFGGNFKPRAKKAHVVSQVEYPTHNRADITQSTQVVPLYEVRMGEWGRRLASMAFGGTEITEGSATQEALVLADHGVIELIHEHDPRSYWEITAEGERLFVAGLKEDLVKKVKDLKDLSETYQEGEYVSEGDKKALRDFAAWFRKNFRVDSSKTPRGMRNVKDSAQALLRAMESYGQPGGMLQPGAMDMSNSSVWLWLSNHLDDLVKNFTAEGDTSKGKKTTLTEIKGKYATYFNRANTSEKKFKEYAERLDQIFGALKGFHKKALTGSLKVAFVGAQQMKVQGKYRESADELWVKATPKVMARGSGGYGSPEYIIVHELGHRYEKYNRPSIDFDRQEWRTTRYSMKDGEAFAELFALSHFNIKGTWDQERVEKFKRIMSGKEKAAAGVSASQVSLIWAD